MVHTSCPMVQDGIGYLRALPNFCPCIPTSIPIPQLKRAATHHRTHFAAYLSGRVQRVSRFDSKSAIQTGFTKCSYMALMVVACVGLTGEKDAVVNFEYDGAFSSEGFISLSSLATHLIYVEAVDTDGNVGSSEIFALTERSPYHIATIEGHTDSVNFCIVFHAMGKPSLPGHGMARSSCGTLKRKTKYRYPKAWRRSNAVAFSTDGKKVASGSYDGIIELWDVETQTKYQHF